MALVDLKSNLSTAFKKTPVDFIDDKSGAKGFTENFTDPNDSKFVGISNNTYTYPNTVIGGRLMNPNKSTNKFPGPQNFFDDDRSGAQGFSLKNRLLESKFLGIDDEVYNYPDTVQDGRLMQPNGAVAFPGPQNFFDNNTSGVKKGFTLNFTNPNDSKFLGINGTQYNYPSQVSGNRLMKPNKASSYPGPQNFFVNATSGAKGFSLFNSIGNSKYLGIDGETYTYPNTVLGNRLMRPKDSATFPGPQNFFNNTNSGAQGFNLNFTNRNDSKFIGISGAKYSYPMTVQGGRLMNPSGNTKFPGPQNFFVDNTSGAKGFTLNFTNPNESKFLGIQRSTSYTYPSSVAGGRLMQPKDAAKFPGPQNFFNDDAFGSKGFTLNFTNPNESKFLGIDGETYTYPSTVKDGRLWNPPGSKRSSTLLAFPGPQNYFNDERWGSKGFTLNFGTDNNSKFLGIEGRQFNYPKTVLPIHKNSVREVPMANSKFDKGTATLENQLGNGSVFPFIKNKSYSSKIFSASGYNEQKRYSDNIKSIKGDPEKSLLYKKSTEQNSPSAIEEQYKKFNLREEAYNFQYIDHPLILRGLQRKGKEEPNRWGFDSLVNFDDGLIQGGISTVVERTANDVARIAKWMASPKGLLWIVKQVGLGLTNPKVETNPLTPGPLGRQTRIHTGVTTLLSVAGNAIGLHFTRHSLPWVNKLADYEQVIKAKKLLFNDVFPDPSNRLLTLSREYQVFPTVLNLGSILSGLPSLTLSGLAGPQSVYGIGVTPITRGEATANFQTTQDQYRFNPFSPNEGYAKNLSGTFTAISSINSRAEGYKRPDWKRGGLGTRKQRPPLNVIADKLFEQQDLFSEAKRTIAPILYRVRDNVYNPTLPTSDDVPDGNKVAKDLIGAKNYSTKLAAGALRANTNHDSDPNKDQSSPKIDNTNWDKTTRKGSSLLAGGAEFKTVFQRLEDDSKLKAVSDKKPYAAGALRANTNKDFDSDQDNASPKIDNKNWDESGTRKGVSETGQDIEFKPVSQILKDDKFKKLKAVSDKKPYTAGALRATTNKNYDSNQDNAGTPVNNTNYDDTERNGIDYETGNEIKFKSVRKLLTDNDKLKFSIDQKNYTAGLLRADTKNTFDTARDKSNTKIGYNNADSVARQVQQTPDGQEITYETLKMRMDPYNSGDSKTPGAKVSNMNVDLATDVSKHAVYTENSDIGASINRYAVLTYTSLPKNKNDRRNFQKDFRNLLPAGSEFVTGRHDNSTDYYTDYNLETKYGFGNHGASKDTNKIPQRGKGSFLVYPKEKGAGNGVAMDLKSPADRFGVINSKGVSGSYEFRGDKVNAINVIVSKKNGVNANSDLDLYPAGTRDFVKLIFEDPESGAKAGNNNTRITAMVFRGTVTGITDSFSPGWNGISIMGRPDGAYLYSSFERNLSFTFMVAATSRQEMMPIWRKLNYLATYTMPDFNDSQTRPSGPMLRLTLGDLFNRTPGFLNGLTYTIPDEATWDIADDEDVESSMAVQLPTMVEVSVDFKVIFDYRPQQHGQIYTLHPTWLTDSENTQGLAAALKEEEDERKKAAANAVNT